MKFKRWVSDKLARYQGPFSNYRLVNSHKLYELWEENHLRRVLSHYAVDCVFDVGANHGQYARMLRQRVGYEGLIVSFEPIPEAVSVLQEASSGDPQWLVEELAISSQDGQQTFNVMAGSQFSSLSLPRHDEVALFEEKNVVQRSVTVKAESLETAYNRIKRTHAFNRPFLKLDTQGYDVQIVQHGQAVIREFVGLQSELAVRRIYQDSVDFREAITQYEQSGFTLSAIVPNNAGHFPQLVEVDCIMIRADLIESTAN